MSRYWLGRTAGSWTTRLAAGLAIALVAGFTAAQQGSLGGPTPGPSTLVMGAGTAAVTRPGAGLEWSFTRGRPDTLEIRLDDLMSELGRTGRTVLDRETVLELVARALERGESDAPVESMELGAVLEQIPRVRIVTEGRSIVLGPRSLQLLARLAVGRSAGPVTSLTVGEVLDALPRIALNRDGSLAAADRRTENALGAVFGGIKPMDHSRDRRFEQRQAIQQSYDRVVHLVSSLRREGFATDSSTLYDEAARRLMAEDDSQAVALLEGHLRLEEEYENAETSGTSHADRIRFRWQARRWAFGEETAALLFSREEAMERYQIDKMALEADDYSAPQDKSRWLANRRNQLKVELASEGSYVGFPDEGADSSAAGREPRQRRSER